MRVLPLDFQSVLRGQPPDHIGVGAESASVGNSEISIASPPELMESTGLQGILNRARHWRGIIAGCAVILLLAGTIAMQFRAPIVSILGSAPRARTNVQTGINTPSRPTPNSSLLQHDAAIPTVTQSLKDNSRLTGLPEIGQRSATSEANGDLAPLSMDRTGLLTIAHLWLAEGSSGDRTKIASGVSGPAPSGTVQSRGAVLFEDDPKGKQEKSFQGKVVWRTELSPRPGRAPDLALIAEVEFPERKVRAIWSLRRINSEEVPASHTIEIKFELPPEYPLGQILNVPGVLATEAGKAVGDQLIGKSVKVSNGYFRIDLSSLNAERERNIQLLKERPWFDIPIAYSNGRRGLLVVEKGYHGNQVFSEFFKEPQPALILNEVDRQSSIRATIR